MQQVGPLVLHEHLNAPPPSSMFTKLSSSYMIDTSLIHTEVIEYFNRRPRAVTT